MSEILFEYIISGNSIKVTAIDSETKIEAVVVAPIGLSEQQLQKLAMEKLDYIKHKTNNKDCG